MAAEKKGGMGLLPRLIMGIFIPILVAFAFIGVILFLNVNVGKFQFASIKGILLSSLNELGAAGLKESTDSLNKLGETIIRQKADDVAKQLEIHLRFSQGKRPLDRLFNGNDVVLKDIVTQKVGETGYLAVFDGQNILRYHPNPKLINFETKKLYDKLGPAFVEINETALSGKDAGGYYQWPDEKGKMKPKYMWITHVKGTNLLVSSTTWIDEFSKPSKAITVKMNQLQQTYSEQYNRRFGILVIVLAIVLVALLSVIYVFSYNVVQPIRQLSEVADKISMGELNATVNVKAGGEIGLLAASIERMQTSVRAAIERLQKRR